MDFTGPGNSLQATGGPFPADDFLKICSPRLTIWDHSSALKELKTTVFLRNFSMFLDVSQVDHSFQFLTTSKALPDPKAGFGGMAAWSSTPIILFLDSASPPKKNQNKRSWKSGKYVNIIEPSDQEICCQDIEDPYIWAVCVVRLSSRHRPCDLMDTSKVPW